MLIPRTKKYQGRHVYFIGNLVVYRHNGILVRHPMGKLCNGRKSSLVGEADARKATHRPDLVCVNMSFGGTISEMQCHNDTD